MDSFINWAHTNMVLDPEIQTRLLQIITLPFHIMDMDNTEVYSIKAESTQLPQYSWSRVLTIKTDIT